MVKIYRECEQFMEEEEYVLHSDYAAIKSHLTAIAAVLGVPDAEPEHVVELVKELIQINDNKVEENWTRFNLVRGLEKERDELLAQRDMMVEALEKFMTFHQGHVLGTPELGHIVATGRAALAKVRQGGEG